MCKSPNMHAGKLSLSLSIHNPRRQDLRAALQEEQAPVEVLHCHVHSCMRQAQLMCTVDRLTSIWNEPVGVQSIQVLRLGAHEAKDRYFLLPREEPAAYRPSLARTVTGVRLQHWLNRSIACHVRKRRGNSDG